jgi:UDPglucose--hexose-1-phosphate uridylyltransferase
MIKSEIRQDYIHDRSVLIAPSRKKRPHQFTKDEPPKVVAKKDCPFCPEQANKVRAILTLGPKNNWRVKVINNIFPIVSLDNPKAYGVQEVVIETPRHDLGLAELSQESIEKVIFAFQKRSSDLSKNKKLRYILIYKNYGGRAGASLQHSHSQIFSTSFLPPHILDKLKRAEEYEIRYGHCYYCDLIKKEKHGPRWIWDDQYFAAFTPYASTYNFEAWIIPKRHVDNIHLLNKKEVGSLTHILKQMLLKLDNKYIPYNFYLHQVIEYREEHFYIRIAPRRDVWAGLELGSRLIVNTESPEDAAKFYRR